MKRILITGAAGFLGSHLCDRFIAEGYYVIGMDNLITGDLDNIAHLFPHKNFEFYHQESLKDFNPNEILPDENYQEDFLRQQRLPLLVKRQLKPGQQHPKYHKVHENMPK